MAVSDQRKVIRPLSLSLSAVGLYAKHALLLQRELVLRVHATPCPSGRVSREKFPRRLSSLTHELFSLSREREKDIETGRRGEREREETLRAGRRTSPMQDGRRRTLAMHSTEEQKCHFEMQRQPRTSSSPCMAWRANFTKDSLAKARERDFEDKIGKYAEMRPGKIRTEMCVCVWFFAVLLVVHDSKISC